MIAEQRDIYGGGENAAVPKESARARAGESEPECPPGHVLATHRAEGEELFTALCRTEGADREEFGTACTHTYGIYIADRAGSIFLPDLARREEEAFAVFARFADGGVTSETALEVADAMLG